MRNKTASTKKLDEKDMTSRQRKSQMKLCLCCVYCVYVFDIIKELKCP